MTIACGALLGTYRRFSSVNDLMAQKQKAPPMRTARPEDEAQRSVQRIAPLRMVQAPNSDDEDLLDVAGFKPLLPDAQWFEAKFTGWSTAIIFASPKVFWEFEITQPGYYAGLSLFRAFRVRNIVGRPSKRGKFVPTAGGDMYQTLCRLLDLKTRADRVSLRPLMHMLFRIRTRTVYHNHRQEKLAEHARYSTIDAIERGE